MPIMTASSQMTQNYAIISVDFNVFKDGKEQRRNAITKLNESMDKIRGLGEMYFEPQNVLIIWKNNPDEAFLTKKLGHSNDNLIMSFCERIAIASQKNAVQLFIDRPQTLFEEGQSMFTVLERLVSIWKGTKLIPVLLQDDFLSLDNNELFGKERWREEWRGAASAVERLKISHMAKDITQKEKKDYFASTQSYYEHFYAAIETLIRILAPQEKKLTKKSLLPESSMTEFIHTYFMWQAGIYSSVEKAQEAMAEEIPTSTWYRYVDKFEENIVYEEYTVAYWRYLFLGNDEEMQNLNPSYKKDGFLYRPKKGRTIDAIQYICFVNREERLSFFEPDHELKDPYMEFEEIRSLIDVERMKYTAHMQFKNLRSRKTGPTSTGNEHYGKTLIQKKLAEYGYEVADLYSIFSKKSPYYKQTQEMAFDEESMSSILAIMEDEATDPDEQEWQDFLRTSMENPLKQ